MKYPALILRFAFQRSLIRTDLLAAVLTALAPLAYWLMGLPMPSNIGLTVSLMAGALVVGVILLRLLLAPYFIWKEDQARIAKLTAEIDDIQKQKQARLAASFEQDRAVLIKRLMTLLGDLREANQALANGAEVAKELHAVAGPFLVFPDFKKYWMTFEKNMKCQTALRSWQGLPAAQGQDEKVLRRFMYHTISVEAAIEGMVAWLAHDNDHEQAYTSIMDTLERNCPDVDFSFAMPPSRGFTEIDYSGLAVGR